ncbi:MAG: ABC transporter ATP-binding protein [Phycisphaerae bacterium]|nr:ABC transporter ATP-binding protein [Phycisphaerae bacterium]
MVYTIRINGISKSFGRIQALDSVTFDVPPRSIFGLLGPNGAGKTTLFSVVANFLKANAGSVEVLGIDTRRISQLRGRLSIFPQDAAFQRNVPILNQLVFFRLLGGRTHQEAKEEVMQTLELVGLESVAKRRVGTLSHGMIKRLGIAQAFLGRPEVILLDEPTAGLDPASAHQTRDLIKKLQERGTVMVSSHNLAEIQELCDHVAILDLGKLVFAGSVEAITRADCEYDLELSRPLQNDEVKRLSSLTGLRDIRSMAVVTANGSVGSASYLVTLDVSHDQDAIVAELLRNVLDMGITPRKFSQSRSLEKHFLEVTRGPDSR